MENREVAKILQETAQLLEIDGAIIGRYRSYEKVAELLYSIHERIEDLAKDNAKLKELPGVGDGMAAHIREILETGDYSLRQKLLKKYPLTLMVRTTPTNGLSGAVLHGMKVARGKYLCVMDADLQHPPEKLPDLLAMLRSGERCGHVLMQTPK